MSGVLNLLILLGDKTDKSGKADSLGYNLAIFLPSSSASSAAVALILARAALRTCARWSRQAKVFQRRASESPADIRLDDQFQYSNV
jgi:hypothetical protein